MIVKSIFIVVCLFLLFINSSHSKRVWVQKHVRYDDGRRLEDINQLSCPDSNTCFAISDVTDFWRLYRTTDQGDTWDVQYEAPMEYEDGSWFNVTDFYVQDEMNIIVRPRYHIKLFKTTDGGRTFNLKTYDGYSEDKILNTAGAIGMYDNNIGVMQNYTHLIYTIDNWETIDTLAPYYSYIHGVKRRSGYNFIYIDSTNLAMNRWARNSGDFVRYDFLDSSWSQYSNILEPDPENSILANGMLSLEFVNDSLIFACGSRRIGQNEFANSTIWRSYDFGKTWELLFDHFVNDGFGLQSIAFENETHGIALGPWGTCLESFDGGDTWQQITLPDGLNSSGVGIEYCGSYAIARSRVGGIFRLETIASNDQVIEDKEMYSIVLSNQNINISIEDSKYNTYSLNIFDLNGRQVYSTNINSGLGKFYQTYDLSELNTGAFLYNLVSNDRVVTNGSFVISE